MTLVWWLQAAVLFALVSLAAAGCSKAPLKKVAVPPVLCKERWQLPIEPQLRRMAAS